MPLLLPDRDVEGRNEQAGIRPNFGEAGLAAGGKAHPNGIRCFS